MTVDDGARKYNHINQSLSYLEIPNVLTNIPTSARLPRIVYIPRPPSLTAHCFAVSDIVSSILTS